MSTCTMYIVLLVGTGLKQAFLSADIMTQMPVLNLNRVETAHVPLSSGQLSSGRVSVTLTKVLKVLKCLQRRILSEVRSSIFNCPHHNVVK